MSIKGKKFKSSVTNVKDFVVKNKDLILEYKDLLFRGYNKYITVAVVIAFVAAGTFL